MITIAETCPRSEGPGRAGEENRTDGEEEGQGSSGEEGRADGEEESQYGELDLDALDLADLALYDL